MSISKNNSSTMNNEEELRVDSPASPISEVSSESSHDIPLHSSHDASSSLPSVTDVESSNATAPHTGVTNTPAGLTSPTMPVVGLTSPTAMPVVGLTPTTMPGIGTPSPPMVGMCPPPLSMPDMPPAYNEIVPTVNAPIIDGPHYVDPPLGLHPPSYEEVQQQKALEAGIEYPGGLTSNNMPIMSPNNLQALRDSSLAGLGAGPGCHAAEMTDGQILGSDLMFLGAFTGTFIFNWVALILILCFCRTIAARSGALAGFGLSSALAVIVRHPGNLGSDRNAWLLWLILVFGLLICVRAILQYASAKRKWQQLPQNGRSRFAFVC